MWVSLGLGLWILLHLALRAPRRTEVVAHRGAAGEAPENTLVAVQVGRDSGARYLEVDVQRSRDGSLVVLHDRTVDRTTDGSGDVTGLTHAELSELDAGSWFAPRFRGERIPTLQSVLDSLDGWQGILVVEAKSPGRYPGIASELAAALNTRKSLRVEVVSFDHDWLASFREQAPGVPTGALAVYPAALPDAGEANRIGVFWLAPILDPSLMARAHRRGLDVWVWTVDAPFLQDLLAWLGVDGLTTNFPSRTAIRWDLASPSE